MNRSVALVLALLNAVAALQAGALPGLQLRSHARAAPLLMSDEPVATEEPTEAPTAPGEIPSFDKMTSGRLTPPTEFDESKRMSAPIPMPFLYGGLALAILGGILDGDPNAAHGFKMPF